MGRAIGEVEVEVEVGEARTGGGLRSRGAKRDRRSFSATVSGSSLCPRTAKAGLGGRWAENVGADCESGRQ